MKNAIDSFNKYLRNLVEDADGIIIPVFGAICLVTDIERQQIIYPAIIIREIAPFETNVACLDQFQLQIDTAYSNYDRSNALLLCETIYNHFNLKNNIGLNIDEYNYIDQNNPVLTGHKIKISKKTGIKPLKKQNIPELKRYSFDVLLTYVV